MAEKTLHALAEKFLRQYLEANPGTKVIPVPCPAAHGRSATNEAKSLDKALDVAAQKCIEQIQERIDVSEVEQLCVPSEVSSSPASPVIIRRMCHRSLPAFLAGLKKRDGKLLWTHSRSLAFIFSPEDATKVSTTLEALHIPVSMEPLSRSQAAICAEEIADLSREAGRPLSQDQALRYRLRRLKAQLIANLLERGR